MELSEYLENRKKEIDTYIDRYLPLDGKGPALLRKAMRYTIEAGGKRLRPILAITAYEMSGGRDNEEIMPIACALEMVHTFTLIHDDLPAMDNDDLRRGKPTSHKVFGEAMAILAGDALFTEAYNVMLKAKLPGDKLVRILETLGKAISVDGVIGGQVVDINAEREKKCDKDVVQYIHSKKTASFIQASIVVGAMAGDADSELLEYIEEAGYKMGLAFQIVDDLLDEISTTVVMGKKTSKDREEGKCTWPLVYGIEKSKKDAEKLIKEARDLLRKVPDSQLLSEICDFIVQREY